MERAARVKYPSRRRLVKSMAAALAAGGAVAIGAGPRAPLAQAAPATPSGAASSGLPSFVKPRSAWGAAPPVRPYTPHKPTTVVIHHTGAEWYGRPAVEQYLRNIQSFHVGPEREWEDIAYHFLIDLQGTVWAGRPPTVVGNRSIYYDATGLVLICFIGDYDVQQPTSAQMASAAATAAWLVSRFGLSAPAVVGHRDKAPTECPGNKVYTLLQQGDLARRMRAQLETPPPATLDM
ncbi:MAG: N-acetylmuramoyl-L-alanine amidase [Chloroflexi bacterium]|nr:N-acetylmuramoyl-L-alanine amidase [Chloroflexota bacterium]